MLGIGKHNRSGAGDNTLLLAAKISGLFVVGAAIISAIPPSINLLSSHDTPVPVNQTASTTTTSSNGRPGTGLTLGPLANGKLSVAGSAQKDVLGMWVVIGPKPLGGYDTGCGNVADGRWQAQVSTDPSWPNYPLTTVPAYGSCASAGSAAGLKFTLQGTETTTPTPPPGQVLDCTRQFGPSCLTGPGFGPATTYQPNH